ncbi:MAG: hypothetical protein JW768_04410 [Chitinispirillaceae bacterium]|nr:hypothetical protein [Chitinispirillaceae bacterium]
MKYTLTLCTVLLLVVGQANASPVDIMIGSRGYGMGGAYTAIADDPSAAYWNPAGLSQVSALSLMESNWIMQQVQGLNINYASLAVPIKNIGTVSGSWLFAHATLEQGWDYSSGSAASTASANEHTFSLSLGRTLLSDVLIFKRVSLGFSINRHTFDTDAGDGAGLGFDLGLQTLFPHGIALGITGRSLGTDMMGYKIDPEVRTGLGYSITIKEMHRVTAAIDGSYKMNRDYTDASTLEPARHNAKGFGGLEYAVLWNGFEFAARGGANKLVYSTTDNIGYAAGMGIKYLGYSLQYGFKGDVDDEAGLGYGHRVTLVVELEHLLKR